MTREHRRNLLCLIGFAAAGTALSSGCSSGKDSREETTPTASSSSSSGPSPSALPSGAEPSASVIASSGAPSSSVPPLEGVPSDWQQGLLDGPNGPVPAIVVDQFGYRPGDVKIAILRDPNSGYDAAADYQPGANIALVDSATGVPVKTAPAVSWKDGKADVQSGDVVWTFDFSDVTTPGKYFVFDADKGRRSPEFEISETIYREVLRHAVRTFYYQRAGFEKTAEFAGEAWVDGASHLGPEQDGEARAWVDQSNADTARDLRGGWYDAGDYNKYTSWHARYLINLLRTYHFYPDAFGDDTGIPESGNGVPDLLDEVAFGFEWLKRAQDAEGGLICVQGLATGSPPSSADEPSYYGPATTSATLAGAAAFAYGARIFETAADGAFADRVEDFKARAALAWQWAEAHPEVTYFNNDEGKQEGSQGLAAGQQEVDEKGRLAFQVEAAAYLFAVTGESSYRDFFDANYGDATPTYLSHWEVDRHEAALDYAALPDATPSVADAIRADFSELFSGSSGLLAAATNGQDAYRTKIDQFTWGSNQSKAAAGRVLLLSPEYGVDPASADAAKTAAEDYIHYVHGVNPLGLVYLTNMVTAGAEHSAKTLYHTWFAYTSDVWSEVSPTTPGPAPGFLVGGPNPSYELDGCCSDGSECFGSADFTFCAMELTPPLDQPAAKSYLQFNLGWPANSWAVTENSNGYQTQYIRLLAAFVK